MSITALQTSAWVEALVGQIADEFTQRLNRGEQPSIDEYAARHPEIAELLRQLLPALRLIRRPDVEAAVIGASPEARLPALLGDFRLVREVGRGGMGVVYEAEQLSLKNRRVALKILPFAAALDPRRLQRFKHEAQAAANLHHEHIVPVHGVGCADGVHYYAMQFIDGHTVEAVLHELRRIDARGQCPVNDPELAPTVEYRENVPPVSVASTVSASALTGDGPIRSAAYYRRVAQLGIDVALALEHAHQQNVIHRDIKPGNLLLDERGHVWITDFGVALVRDDTRLTLPQERVGTLRYMSPEQALGRHEDVDARSDVYSLGATLYELLTLTSVCPGRDQQELLRQISADEPKSPRRRDHRIPRDLDIIIATALAKSPAHRYPTAQALADDLHAFLDGMPIKARPESVTQRLSRLARSRAAGVVLGVLGAVAFSVVLAVALMPSRQPSSDELNEMHQQEALAAILLDLKAGRKVNLIPDRGRPGYFRWMTDETAGKVADASDGVFQLQDWERGLLELVPDPCCQDYRFSIQVRQEWGARDQAQVGIYFMHNNQVASAPGDHFHCNVLFNDLHDWKTDPANPRDQGNILELQVHRQHSAGIWHLVGRNPNWTTHFPPLVPRGRSREWRTLAVEVHPDAIKIFWEKEGSCVSAVGRPELLLTARPLLADPKEPLTIEFPFAPRGGLGLCVIQAGASFRNATLEPLSP